jgi:fibronectin type 3 domain-containing protein
MLRKEKWMTLAMVLALGAGLAACSDDDPVKVVDPPAAPSNVQATQVSGGVQVSWTASSGATSYNVDKQIVGSGGFIQIATALSGTSYTDSDVSEGNSYNYRVTAVGEGGESSPSDPAGVNIPVTELDAPTNVTAVENGDDVDVSWSAVSEADAYTVQRQIVGQGAFIDLATGLTGTSYTDEAPTRGFAYLYRVVATAGSKVSAPSDPASVVVKA